jgi:hypothetical protein
MAASMEDQICHLLSETLHAGGQRQQAEDHLLSLQTNEAYPISLAAIARHTSVALAVRQVALSTLRLFVENNWSGVQEGDEQVINIPEHSKQILRVQLLELATSGDVDRKIRSAARYKLAFLNLRLESRDCQLKIWTCC